MGWRDDPEMRKAYYAAYYQKNRDRLLSSYSEYQKNNPKKTAVHSATYRARNPEKVKIIRKTYSDAHPGSTVAFGTKFAAEKRHALPSWYDHEKADLIYRQAAWITMASGIKHDVDHVIPFAGSLTGGKRGPFNVCGLHVHTNLQIITKNSNYKKGNRFDPDGYLHDGTSL